MSLLSSLHDQLQNIDQQLVGRPESGLITGELLGEELAFKGEALRGGVCYYCVTQLLARFFYLVNLGMVTV